MRCVRSQSRHGFTLIELLVSMAIVGILAAVALPGYGSAMRRAHRNEARLALLSLQIAEERHYQLHLSYTDAPPGSPQTGRYVLDVELREDGQGYLATASADPAGSQAADRDCARFTVDHTGRRGASSATGEDTSSTCWS